MKTFAQINSDWHQIFCVTIMSVLHLQVSILQIIGRRTSVDISKKYFQHYMEEGFEDKWKQSPSLRF